MTLWDSVLMNRLKFDISGKNLLSRFKWFKVDYLICFRIILPLRHLFFFLRRVIVLHCTASYCTTLCCAVLQCTVLYCTVLRYTVLCCTTLYYRTVTHTWAGVRKSRGTRRCIPSWMFIHWSNYWNFKR